MEFIVSSWRKISLGYDFGLVVTTDVAHLDKTGVGLQFTAAFHFFQNSIAVTFLKINGCWLSQGKKTDSFRCMMANTIAIPFCATGYWTSFYSYTDCVILILISDAS